MLVLRVADCLRRFNPRPREGATRFWVSVKPVVVVSIHAPVRGRRARPAPHSQPREVSIHAPVRGRRGSFARTEQS